MKLTLPIACVAATLAAAASIPVMAQQIEKREFNVVGTWNFLTNWQKLEQPFWTKDLPAATGGKLKGNIKSITEVNLKGTEVHSPAEAGRIRLRRRTADLRRGWRRDHRGVDIAGVARDFKMGREVVTALAPRDAEGDGRSTAPSILGTFPFPEQDLLLQGRHQEHRRSQGQEGPRAGHVSRPILSSGLRRRRRDDRVRRGRAGTREGRRRLRHHRHDAGLQGQVGRGDGHAVPSARRLHGWHLGREPQCLEQAVAGHQDVMQAEIKKLSRTSRGR